MLRGSVAPSYLRATEPLSCIIITKIARNFLIKPEALCSKSLHKPLISRDQGDWALPRGELLLMPWQLSVVMIQCNAGEDGDYYDAGLDDAG